MKAVIWDFNGTILDDFELCLQVINRLLAQRQLPLLTEDSYRSFFDFPVEDYYARIGFDFSAEPFPDLAREYMALYQPASFGCQLRPGVQATLAALRDQGLRQILLSATKHDFLLEQIGHFGLSSFFEEIIGLDDIYGRSKLEMARSWFSQNELLPSETVLVGDTTHDFEVAAAIQCRCLLVGGGHNSVARLQQTGAHVLREVSVEILQLY